MSVTAGVRVVKQSTYSHSLTKERHSMAQIKNTIYLVDDNECMSRDPGCSAGAHCVNVVGTYGCVCNDGYRGTGRNCSGKYIEGTQHAAQWSYGSKPFQMR